MKPVTLSKEEHAMLVRNSERYLYLRDSKHPLTMLYATNQVGDVLTGSMLDAVIDREKRLILQASEFNDEEQPPEA